MALNQCGCWVWSTGREANSRWLRDKPTEPLVYGSGDQPHVKILIANHMPQIANDVRPTGHVTQW